MVGVVNIGSQSGCPHTLVFSWMICIRGGKIQALQMNWISIPTFPREHNNVLWVLQFKKHTGLKVLCPIYMFLSGKRRWRTLCSFLSQLDVQHNHDAGGLHDTGLSISTSAGAPSIFSSQNRLLSICFLLEFWGNCRGISSSFRKKERACM